MTADERRSLQRAVSAYGTENDGNGVGIRFEATLGAEGTWTDGKNPRGLIMVTFSLGSQGDLLTLDVAHEGSHVADWHAFNMDDMFPGGSSDGPTQYGTEHAAYRVSQALAKSLGNSDWSYGGAPLWDKSLESLPPDDREKARAVARDKIIEAGYSSGGKPVTQANPGVTYGQLRRLAYPNP